MPYTPPAQRSPAISTTNTPSLSRRSSYQPGPPARVPASSSSLAPELPRSSSYLTRHRRTPSVNAVEDHTPPPSADTQRDTLHLLTSTGSLRQSPPPRTDESQVPVQAVLSPPDSAQNSSDDEGAHDRGSLKLENLAELQEAIRVLAEKGDERNDVLDRAEEAIASALRADGEPEKQRVEHVAASLPRDIRRKISHARANTDTTVFTDLRPSPAFSTTNSDEESISDEDGGTRMRPPMLRKKSGELVRPALRPASARRRPSSMPGTPTFNTHKAVHFDNKLEHVRHFLQVDRPLAVSAGSSPVEAYDTETEFPFHTEEPLRGTPFEWELVLANFPHETPERRAQPVRVERVYLSTDNKTMIGSVAVANIAFNKLVVARFTLDYWKTTSEVVAEYTTDIRQPKRQDGYDRFHFTIKLADLANLEAKTMFFCVKFVVNGQEHWDNNSSTNFQVDFRKKAVMQMGKRGMQPASSRSPSNSNGALPRSHRKSAGPPRASTMPAFDDFSSGFSSDGFDPRDFAQPPSITHLIGEESGPVLRLPGVKSAINLAQATTQSGTQQAFSTRYDFSASLNAAKQSAFNALGDRSGISMKPKTKTRPIARFAPEAEEATSPLTMVRPSEKSVAPRNFTPAPASLGMTMQDPARLARDDKPALQSQSYNELLDKYCFYGTRTGAMPSNAAAAAAANVKAANKDNKEKEKIPAVAQYDGAADYNYALGSLESSTHSSPVTMAVPVAKKRTEGSSPPAHTISAFTTGPMHGGYQHQHQPWNVGHGSSTVAATAI